MEGSATTVKRMVHLAFIWCGPAFAVLFGAGFGILAGFLPLPAPSATAEQIAALYRDNTTGIRIGISFVQIGSALLIPWGIVIAVQTWRIKGVPLALPLIQISCAVVNAMLGITGSAAWLIAAFRPDELAAGTIRAFNDLGYLLFVMPWTALTCWFVAIGLSMLIDSAEKPTFPRWVGYVALWAAFMVIPATLIIFFKTGPFAWNGLLGFYVPAFSFFVCFLTTSIYSIKAINRESSEDSAPVRMDAER
ncbi:MAG: hypothetical protein ACREQ8_13115 [Woeseiaceae bacterium]